VRGSVHKNGPGSFRWTDLLGVELVVGGGWIGTRIFPAFQLPGYVRCVPERIERPALISQDNRGTN